MRLQLYALLLSLSFLACGKDDDPIIEPITDFPQAEFFPGKFVYVEDQEIFVLDGQGSEQITNTCTTNCFKRNPRWLDEGKKISYTQDFEGVFRVWDDGRYNTNVLAPQVNLWVAGAYSPDENFFAAADRQHVYLYAVDENFDLTLLDTVGNVSSEIGSKLFWSPDGSKILRYRYGNEFYPAELLLLDLVTLETKIISTGEIDATPSWNSQSDKIAYREGPSLYTVDANGENQQQVSGTFAFSMNSPQWSPYGDQILCSGSELTLYDISSGAATKLISGVDVHSVRDARWSADGQEIAFTMHYAEHEGLYVYQASDQKVLKLSDKLIGAFEWYTE